MTTTISSSVPATTSPSTASSAASSSGSSSSGTPLYTSSTPTLSSSGVGSGLDVNGIVTKLMAVEQIPLQQLLQKESSYQAKLSAFGTLKSSLATFQTSVQKLQDAVKNSVLKATSGDATVLGATTNRLAKPGAYQVEVVKTAQAQKLTSASGITDPTAALGTGTLTIDFGAYDAGANSFTVNGNKKAKSLTIDSGNNSLTGIRDAINGAAMGVSASIINDGSSYRLVLASSDTGSANAMRVMISGDSDGNNTDSTGLSKLAYDPTATAGAGKNLSEVAGALDAQLKIDGITVTKSSNTISDAIQGVTLNLLKASSPATTSLAVSIDTSGLQTAVEDMVKSYNDLSSTLGSLSKYDAATATGGALQGDFTVLNIQSRLRNLIVGALPNGGAGGFTSLADAGVSFQKDGTLTLDTTKLQSALGDSTKNVAALFGNYGKTSDSLVNYVSATSATRVGVYQINVTQAATQGKTTGSVQAGLTIDGSNDTLTLAVDGGATTVTLDHQTYASADALASALQAKLNSALAGSGKNLQVTQSSGVLSLISGSYGSNSSVTQINGSAVASLFGTTTDTTGVDVQGSIGGTLATGAGQLLTGSGEAAGLNVLVTGSSTGSRGKVTFSQGYASQISQALSSMLDGKTGSIFNSTQGINASLKQFAAKQATMKDRLTATEAAYRKKFNALDTALASMQQTSSYLTTQLANLPKLTGTSSSSSN